MLSKIIVFTSQYPYSPGEEYFVEEINHLSKEFDNITVVSSEKNIKKEKRFYPKNVHILILNRSVYKVRSILIGILKTLRLDTIKEIIFARKILGYRFNLNILKMILLYKIVSTRQNIWIKKNIQKDQLIILYSYWLSVSAYSLAVMKKKGYKFKAISRAHAYDAFLDRGYLPFRREVYQYLDEIYFISHNAKLQFYEKLNKEIIEQKAKLLTSYLGTKKNSNIVKIDNKNETIFHLVSCSNVYPIKRLDLIIDALRQIKNIRIHWVHFGDGNQKKELESSANKNFLNTKITFDFRGYVPNEAIKKYYETNFIDLFINTSDYEGIPVSIMEALSYGVPIIAKNVGGINEIVVDRYNGILLKKDSTYNDIAKAIEKFAVQPFDEIIKIRSNCLETWQSKFNSIKNYKIFITNIKR